MPLVVLCALGLLIVAAGIESPKVDCDFSINNFRRAIQDVSDWQILGSELGVPWSKLKSIIRYPTLSDDLRKSEMLQIWWDGDVEASWERLSDALDQMDQHRLAAVIRAQCVIKSTSDTDTGERAIPPTDHETTVEEASSVFSSPPALAGTVDVPPTDHGTTDEDVFSLPLVLAGTVGVILVTIMVLLYSRCFGRGYIILILAVLVAIYGIHQQSDQQRDQQWDQQNDQWSDLQSESSYLKPLFYRRNGQKAPNNLPDLVERFLGRSYNVQDITWLLVNTNISHVRAVGIYGPPAIGKSTLAIHSGHEISQYGIEVRYIDLFDAHHIFEHHSHSEPVPLSSPSPSTSISPVLHEVPNDYGSEKVVSLSAQKLLEWAKEVEKDTLLVLDKCDNILGIEGHEQKLKKLITDILHQSPSKLRLIVTSRHKMAIPGLGFRTYYLRELDNDSAVQLLQLQSNHLLSKNDSKVIAALVENNPLALHISASLVDETYTPNQLLAGLKDTPMDVLSADILPDSKKMVPVLYISYKHLDNTTCSCGHHLSLFPGSFTEAAAIDILAMSQFSNPKDCLEKLRDRSLIRPYELAGELRYQHHRLVKEFFNFMLKKVEVVKIFQTSFSRYYSGLLHSLSYATHTTQVELDARFEFDCHNFITLLELVAIHPPLSIESVYWTAYSLVRSDVILNIITEIELFRSLKQISHVLLYNSNEVVAVAGNETAKFWSGIFTRLRTIASSSATPSECTSLCMETFEYDAFAATQYLPGCTPMLFE